MQTFSPFPLRARGLVEQFDAAIKLYKQYFWVLLGWSAITTGASVLGAVLPMGGMAALFLTPIVVGACVCCVAAAVRGQNVEFGQCWRFTQPRFWPVLGLHILSWIVGGLALMVLAAAVTAIIVGGVFAFRESSGAVQLLMGVLAFLILGAIVTVVSTVFITWMGLVPVVVCMEDDKRNTAALGRAYEILRGHWVRITTLMALVGLAILALYVILMATTAMLMGLGRISDMASGRIWSEGSLWLFLIAFVGSATLLGMITTPLYYLLITVFYLDVRVRQEALDLEWTAHSTAPLSASAEVQPKPSFETAATPVAAAQVTPVEFQTAQPNLSVDYGTLPLEDLESTPAADNPIGNDSPFATSTHKPSTPIVIAEADEVNAANAPTPEVENAPAAAKAPTAPTARDYPRPQW